MKQHHLESVVELVRVRRLINNLRAQSLLRIESTKDTVHDKTMQYIFGGQKVGGHDPRDEAGLLFQELDKDFLERLRALMDSYMGRINQKLDELGVEV